MADYRAQRLARIRADYERFTAHSNPMTDNNLIPPPELVQQWLNADAEKGLFAEPLAAKAAQWGADKELDACCALLDKFNDGFWCKELRAARRPKPPSLKEQALAVLDDAELDSAHYNILLRALEQLDD
jgi:hypothetical protein